MDIKDGNFFDIVNETFAKADLSLIGMIIMFLIIIGMVLIGIGVFNLKDSSKSRLGNVYLGSFIVLVAALLSAYNGYIPW